MKQTPQQKRNHDWFDRLTHSLEEAAPRANRLGFIIKAQWPKPGYPCLTVTTGQTTTHTEVIHGTAKYPNACFMTWNSKATRIYLADTPEELRNGFYHHIVTLFKSPKYYAVVSLDLHKRYITFDATLHKLDPARGDKIWVASINTEADIELLLQANENDPHKIWKELARPKP